MITVVPISGQNNQAAARMANQLAQEILRGAKIAGELWEQNIKESLDTDIGTDFAGRAIRSSPGEAPRRETGVLQANVAVEVTEEGGDIIITATAGPGGHSEDPEVAAILEHELNRPFMGPSLEEIAKKIPELLTGRSQ